MTMKLVLTACLLGLTLAHPTYEPVGLDYHQNYGIEEAAKILAGEQALDFTGSRIVGGVASSLGTHPHLGGLVITLTSGATSVCGSSLITNTRAVTAAHCWWDGRNQGRQFVVVLGSTTLFSGGTRVTTTNVQMHAGYNTNNLNNDVAIIVLPWVGYTGVISNILLPSGSTLNNNFAGTWSTAAGFGRTTENSAVSQVLRHVNLQVITNGLCQQTYGPSLVIGSTLCTSSTSNANVCQGDSGGSLGVQNASGQRILIGITSFVAAAGCQRGMPAGFARVTSFAAWIQARL